MHQGAKILLAVFTIAIAIAAAQAGMMGGGGSGGGGGGCGCGGGGGSGGTQVIDPPPGAAFRDPVDAADINPDPAVVEVNLEARMAPVNVNGVTATMFTYNGQFPGPTIRAKQGDTVKIHFKNSLPDGGINLLGFTRGTTNVHTHGWHVSPEEPADAAHIAIHPGDTYDYEYDLALQDSGTLCFYHSHSHGLVAEQHWGGLGGALVTADSTAEAAMLSPYETHLLYLKDITLNGNVPAAYTSTMDYMQGKEGNTVMVNGQVNPVLSMRPGQVQRWQIVNGCNARFFKLSLQNHQIQVIGTDGGLLDRPYAQSSILLAPGERVDLLVKATGKEGGSTFKLLSLPYNRGMSTAAQITLMTVRVTGTTLEQALPRTVNPDAATIRGMDTGMAPKKTFTLSMRMGRGYINGMDFDVKPYTTMSMLGDTEVWTINNPTMMDHPWHQHVNAGQILSITGGDAAYATFYATAPAWKDTIIVPAGGKVTMLVPVKDYAGMTMFHCHILEHEDIGMMGMWHIMDMPM